VRSETLLMGRSRVGFVEFFSSLPPISRGFAGFSAAVFSDRRDAMASASPYVRWDSKEARNETQYS
jgi:hypothetical protein